MKGENIAYFSDGHTEAITEFEISKDFKEVCFTVESGRWFVCRENKFFTVLIDRSCDDEFGAKCNVEYLVTDEIEKIMLYAGDGI